MNLDNLFDIKGKEILKKKKEHVFIQGDKNNSLYFIKTGLLKAYYISPKGKEFVKSFITEGNIAINLSSAYFEKPCTFSLQCIEDTAMLEIPLSLIDAYRKKNHDLSNQVIDLLLEFSLKKEKREFEFLCLSAEDRYKMLSQENSDLLKRLTQNDIAHYLGITPVGLSRIISRNSVSFL
ncbi:MAG: Crp/Fnr family transcriptional regulator [Cocleimonas sp.]|nr:Crp/Fnr family transcriptional regulator [Cocleimonas sp.]